MAEAHQGVAFSFQVTEDEGLHLNVSFEAFKAVMLSGLRSWRKMFMRILNRILNGVYPSHPLRGLIIITGITCLNRYKIVDVSFGIVPIIQSKLPSNLVSQEKSEVVATALFASVGWLALVSLRRYSLQALYSYHGWMYDSFKSPSMKTKIWTLLLKILTGGKPNLYSYQNSLPYLPVPNLKDTVTRYLRSVRPLLDDENYKRIEKAAIQFQNGVGRRLQRYLIFKSWISSNYVSDWWEEYVYLRGRSPLMVNSNFYALDSLFKISTDIQAARAANCIYTIMNYRRDLDNETLKPIVIQDLVPLCSRQYERQFNTTRIPGEVTDQIVHYKDTKHLAVYSKGKWYKLYVYYQSQMLNAKEIEIQIQKILDDESVGTKGEKYLAALTAGDRVPWAQARKKFFSRGVNKSSLAAIEKAAFALILDEDDYHYTPNEVKELDRFARAMLHGKGHDRWFDKSFNLIVSKNGRCGLNTEHSWADAPITGHLWETLLIDEIEMVGYDEAGHSKGVVRYEELPDPIRLKWDFNAKAEDAIMSSYAVAEKLLNDVDLHILVHSDFGKGLIKDCRLSPDAFIQMALQLAYYRDIGQHHLTYEASMTRLFREGRTETVRSCSVESSNWVKAMVNDAPNDEKIALLKKACDYHQQQYRDAMTGKGVDRHIFCLYVVSRYLEVDTPFLKEVLSEPWRLSTSQTPSAQTSKIDFKKYPQFISAGGGFGPVADDGYGVSYIITGENIIFFHISSKKSSPATDSFRFGQQIKQAMADIKGLYDVLKQTKAAAAAAKQ